MNGPPDLKVAGLTIWVHGYAYPSAVDEWDGNWLRATAHAGASGAEVTVTGTFLDTVSFLGFAKDLRALSSSLSGSAKLTSVEPNLQASVEIADRTGHLAIRVEITPDNMTQQHRFDFESDQTFLAPMIKQCEAILARFPVRQAAARGV